MWSLLGIFTAAAIMIALEVPSLLKNKRIKELWAFSVLLLLATIASVAKSLRLPISNPMDWISFVFRPASDALFSWLK